MGGFVGIVNLATLGAAGYLSYKNWNTPSWDRKRAIIVSAGLLALFAGEGLGAERYSKTPEGQKARRKAKEEGSELYKHVHEIILRPGLVGGLVGVVNTGVLATVAYYGYIHWDKPVWDRRNVSVISIGILSLFISEGLAAAHYRENNPK